jgi:nicotinate-nucleotide adenylyltransferase
VKAKAPRKGVSRETPSSISAETDIAPLEENAITEDARAIFGGARTSSHVRLPPHPPGLRVGIFGGSFNPPHEGHRAASLLALRRLHLDCVWWLVSPGNPLKDKAELAPLAARMRAAQKLANHPRIRISGIEAAIGTTYSFETIAWLKRRCPGVHFVWIMGADNLAGLHRWKRWRDLISLVPIAVIDRPGSTLKSMSSRGGAALAPYRLNESAASRLATAPPPAFAFLHGPRSSLSSTALRARAAS